VILSQTIQELRYPETLINEILRIGRYGIVSFPNFGFLHIRLQLFLNGRMPKSGALPHDWYNTPDIHLLTLSDFREFCRKRGIKINRIVYFKGNRHQTAMIFPNLFSEGCVIMITR
jgi:methionine biosynthesis protein MetW